MIDTNQPTREQLIELAVLKAAEAATGSFSQRNPMLGKMVRCPYCSRRRRQNEEQCCNPTYKIVNTAEVSRAVVAKKRKNPRLSRHRPPLFEIHQRLVEMKAQPGFVEREGLSGIVEAQVVRKRTARSKKRRDQQRLSRRINRRVR